MSTHPDSAVPIFEQRADRFARQSAAYPAWLGFAKINQFELNARCGDPLAYRTRRNRPCPRPMRKRIGWPDGTRLVDCEPAHGQGPALAIELGKSPGVPAQRTPSREGGRNADGGKVAATTPRCQTKTALPGMPGARKPPLPPR